MSRTRVWTLGIAGLLAGFLCGCASHSPPVPRPLRFTHDTLAFTNQTHWTYSVDPVTRRQSHVRTDPPPRYALRCFVMARTVKQFHLHAAFAPHEPAPREDEARNLIRAVVRRSPRQASPDHRRITIPGFADLRSFSAACADLFMEECGGTWQSYVQRGHWRMLLPFPRFAQRIEARELLRSVVAGQAPVVHVIDWPTLDINHALVLIGAEEQSHAIVFSAFDPNAPSQPVPLRFELGSNRFSLPATPYFRGGDVSVYEVYCSAFR